MSNRYKINKCPIWKTLGVTECDYCPDVDKCWGDEVDCNIECEFCPYPCTIRDIRQLTKVEE